MLSVDNSTDKALLDIAKAVPQIFGKGCIACRYGRNEFLVLVDSISSDEAAAKKAEEILAVGKAGDTSIRIGVASWPEDGSTYEELLGAATQALTS
ncbi:MAG: diguanylate cyclase [Defluviitaleaceae bacterium]|nr:diguanylate cyclase [Defluviitaleaceae bacterium]